MLKKILPEYGLTRSKSDHLLVQICPQLHACLRARGLRSGLDAAQSPPSDHLAKTTVETALQMCVSAAVFDVLGTLLILIGHGLGG